MSQESDSPDVRHEPDRSRFAVYLDGEDVPATARYARDGDTLTLLSTHVPESAEGGGVGSGLARAALDYARDQGLRVVPRCPFMAAYIRRHPEYSDLVDGAAG
jgi:uncharacterized protein